MNPSFVLQITLLQILPSPSSPLTRPSIIIAISTKQGHKPQNMSTDDQKTPKQTTTTTNSNPSSTPTPSSQAAAATHTIQVGHKEDPHQYVPHELKAKVGDTVVFEFYPRNHSVVQADFMAPCMPADGDYFFSGIKNDFEEVNGQVVGGLPTWNWTVKSNAPTFFYCTGADSCIVNGMVGVINPNETHDWKSQNKAALEAPYMLLPGQSMPAEGGGAGTGTTATHVSSSSPISDNNNEPSQSSSSFSSSSHLSNGAIAGIVIGSVAVVAVLGVLLFLLGRNRIYKKWLSHSYEGSGMGSASSSRDVRTAKWAFSASAATAAGNGGGDTGDGDGGGVPGGTLTRPATGFGLPRYPSMEHTGTGSSIRTQTAAQTQSVIYSSPESTYGFPTPTPAAQLGSQMQVPHVQPGQHPYWIWDQNIQPSPLHVKKQGGPSELEGETRR
ncbi:hypothetical protein BDV06DRAFT_194027 [Aspergillus oleicola]